MAALIGIMSTIAVPALSGVVALAYRVHADQVLAGASARLAARQLTTGTFHPTGSGGDRVDWQEAQNRNPFWHFRLRHADGAGFLMTGELPDPSGACPALGWNEYGRISGNPVCHRSE